VHIDRSGSISGSDSRTGGNVGREAAIDDLHRSISMMAMPERRIPAGSLSIEDDLAHETRG